MLVRRIVPLLTLMLLLIWGFFAMPVRAMPLVLSGTYNVAFAILSDNDQYAAFSSQEAAPSVLVHDFIDSSLTLLWGPDAQLVPTSLRFTPDSQTLVFTRRNGDAGEIYRVPSAGGTAQVVVSGSTDEGFPTDFTITPDSQTVVYVADGIFTVPLTGGTPIELSAGLPDGAISGLTLSPSGAYVAFIIAATPTPILAFAPVAGGSPVIATVPNSAPIAFVFAEADNTLFFVGTAPATIGRRLYRIPLTGGTATALTPPSEINAPPRLSPDGEYLLYDGRANLSTDRSINRLTVSTNSVTAASAALGTVSVLTLAPTGDRAFFIEATNSTSGTLRSLEYDPPTPPVTIDTVALNAALQPTTDGDIIVYQTTPTDTAGLLYSAAADGSSAPILLYPTPEVRRFFLPPSESEVFFIIDEGDSESLVVNAIGGGQSQSLFTTTGVTATLQVVDFLADDRLLMIDFNGDPTVLDSLYLIDRNEPPTPTPTSTPTATPTSTATATATATATPTATPTATASPTTTATSTATPTITPTLPGGVEHLYLPFIVRE